MNIIPIHADAANRRHWVVRTLRYFGFLLVILGTIGGTVYARALLTFPVAQALNLSLETAQLITIVLGALLSFSASLLVTLPYWGLALVIDDLHALRIYASGFAAYGPEDGR